MTLAALKYEFNPVRQQTRFLGVSPESTEVRKRICNAALHLGDSIAFQTRFSQERSAVMELIRTVRECVRPNWDGYGADPVRPEAFREAIRFLEELPTGVPTPEFEVLPHGEIALEWYRQKGQSFMISLSGDSMISYAGLFGPGIKAHGSEYFFESIPAAVLHNLRRLFS